MKYALTAAGAVIVAVAVYVLFFLPSQSTAISWRTVAVELGNPAEVKVTFEVTKDPAASAECQVTAVGPKRDIVNRLAGIRIPPAPTGTTRHVVVVPTDQRATDATVTYCALTGSP